MSTAIRARQALRRGVAAAIIAAMLATAAPASAQSNNDTAGARTGNGGSVGIAGNVVALVCVALVPACPDFNGGMGTGGMSGTATATNVM